MLEIQCVCAVKICGLCDSGTAEDLTAQFTLDFSVCCVLKAEALSSFIVLMLSTSNSMATWSKDFLLEFIELSRQEECLWEVKLKDYYNRSKKDQVSRSLN